MSFRAMVGSNVALEVALGHLLGAHRNDAANPELAEQRGGIGGRNADVSGHREDVRDPGGNGEHHRVAEDLARRREITALADVTTPRRSSARAKAESSRQIACGADTSIRPVASRHICGDMNTGA